MGGAVLARMLSPKLDALSMSLGLLNCMHVRASGFVTGLPLFLVNSCISCLSLYMLIGPMYMSLYIPYTSGTRYAAVRVSHTPAVGGLPLSGKFWWVDIRVLE